MLVRIQPRRSKAFSSVRPERVRDMDEATGSIPVTPTERSPTMEVAFTIPVWLLWTVGIVGGLAILGLAALGLYFIVAFWNWRPF